MQRVQDQRRMTALVKSSFTEALVVVLKCTYAINSFEEDWGKKDSHLLNLAWLVRDVRA